MMKIALNDFLGECITRDPESDGLRLAELYGLYVSWCAVKNTTPASERAFTMALRNAGIRPAGHGPCPGMAMTGVAARDYIVHREIPLYALDPGCMEQDPPATPDVAPIRNGDAARPEPFRWPPVTHSPAA